MNLLDRFSSHLRDVLARSIHLAAELKNLEVEPIHLFFAVSGEHGSVAAEIINRLKITPKTIEQALLSLPVRKTDLLHTPPRTVKEQTLTPLSPITKTILEKAMAIAQDNNHNYIGTEHLFSALVEAEDPLIVDVLQVNAVDMEELLKQLDTVLSNATHFPHLTEITEVAKKIEDNVEKNINLEEEIAPLSTTPPKVNKKKESVLEFFGTNLTNQAVQKNIDPVIGRDNEIERVIQILCRRTKNNPLLLGEPGVGKTAIVEGLAKKILEGKVPDILLNKKIYTLDMSMLIAGTIYRGEFEARLRQVIEEATSNPNIILFIDEIHNIVGAGSNQGTMDAANILKPALSRGLLRCIGATTPAEFKKYIEHDAALERRFQTVYAKEPNTEDAIKILKGIKQNYELYHKVGFSDEAVEAAVRLSERYITNKFLPDKAIDLLDETAAAKRLGVKSSARDSKLSRLEQKIEIVVAAKEAAAREDKFDEAVKMKKEEDKLRAELKKTALESKNKKIELIGVVTEKDILLQVAKIIGTKPSDLLLDDSSSLDNLEKMLAEHIVGQDEALKDVSRQVRQAKLGLSHPERPLASFMFVGESGVGKTELAKILAKTLYSSRESFIKLDMSEFNESFGVSKLLGSPAGYIGFKEGNQFTDKIKMNPHCVILFDEIDKAHRDIVKLLLQMLENGEITDSTGKTVSLRHSIIILTTSYGAADLKKTSFGFGKDSTDSKDVQERATEKLKEYFSPEVINRLDKIVFFKPLSRETLTRLADLEIKKFNEQLTNYSTSLTSDEKVLEWVISQLPETGSGARAVRRFVRERVENLMSDIILGKKIKKRYTLSVTDNNLSVK
ncbi:MAG: ATP-dependent Clp protease ATP-binding subunit [Patescibacteria group bacterium]|jgi:ATP-dependent Clp protease ATP-binding subunit ClpC